jgi:hypothetical protein
VDSGIGTLGCEYRVHGAAAAARTAHLDEVARSELAGVLESALAAVYGDDPAVYVVREVTAELALRVDRPDVARRWGEALATAIVETIAQDSGDGANVVRFDDEPDYLARFIADHVRGNTDHWYYRPLASLREWTTAEVVLTLLDDRPAAPVLAALHRHETLPAVLAALPVSAQADLAELALGRFGAPADDLAGLWPLLMAAVRLADHWPLWTGAPREAVDVARDYRSRPVPNWQDPAALTMIVVDVLRHLESRGEIRLPAEPPPPNALAAVEWLDLPLLRQQLATRLPPTRRAVATPLEQSVRQAVTALLERMPSVGTGPAAAIRLRAAMAADHPEWTADPTADAVVARVIAGMVETPATPDRPAESVEESDCAGVLLFLRAVSDLRLPALLARCGRADRLPALLLAVAMRLTDADVRDPAVQAFAGVPENPDELSTEDSAAIAADLDVVLARLGLDVQAGLADLSDDLAGRVAVAVLRAWSRWLSNFEDSSVPYLLANFVRRPGRLRWTADRLVVELAPRPLDVVVRLAGYDQDLESVPWLGDRRVVYRMDGE